MIDSESLKETIRQQTDLVTLVAEQVSLRRSGRDMVGLCPFHQEKTASFSVSSTKQIFKCFGCGAGGDIFTFVQLRERVTFPEALRILADRAGIDLARHVGRSTGEGIDRADMAKTNAWAQSRFAAALADPAIGAVAREYLVERAIPDDMVARFGLGWAPDDSRWIMAEARKAGIGESLLKAVGLVQVGESRDGYGREGYGSGSEYGVFRGRLMFPIRDTMNRVIGFGGRTLTSAKAKYLNTAQNAMFDKGRHLYGIDLARNAMAQTRRAVVVEGYTDCMAAHQHGFAETVATLGTALTEEHIGQLRRWCDEVVFVFDSDAAGQEAAERALGVALRHNLSVRVGHVPDGKDPCDFLGTHGPEEFTKVLNSANDALRFKWERTLTRFAESGGTDQKEAIRAFVGLVAEMVRFGTVDAIQRGLIVNQLSKLLGLPPDEINALLAGATKSSGRSSTFARSATEPTDAEQDASLQGASLLGSIQASGVHGDAEQSGLLLILKVLVNEPAYYERVARVFRPARIEDGRLRNVAAQVVALCEQVGEFRAAELLGRFGDPADARLVTDLMYAGERLGNYDATIAETLERLEALEPLRGAREDADVVRRGAGDASDEDVQDGERLRRMSRVHVSKRGFAPSVPAATHLERRDD